MAAVERAETVHYKCGHIWLLVTVMTRSVVQGIWQRYSDSAAERVCTRRFWGAASQQTRHHHSIGSPCFSLTWAQTCRGSGTAREIWLMRKMRKPSSFSVDCRPPFSKKKKKKKKGTFPLVCVAFITNIQSMMPVVKSSSCGGDRIMFRNVWGNLWMIPDIFAFTCQRWQPETCRSRT